MPPQPLSHGLLYPLLKGVHVHRQKKAVHQALGNMTPFTFLPYLYTSIRKEQLAIQLEYGLPCLRCSGRGCHAHPDLSLWLLNDNTPWWLGRSLGYNIAQTDRDLLGNTLPLSGSTSGRKRRGSHLTSALRWLLLRGLLALGTKRSMVMVFQVTMSPPRSDSMSEELINSTATCSISRAGASGSTSSSDWVGSSWTEASFSTGAWASCQRRRDTHSADSSRKGTSSSEQVYR